MEANIIYPHIVHNGPTISSELPLQTGLQNLKTGNSKDFMRRPVFNSGHRFLSKLVFAMTINVKYTLQNSYRYNFLSQWKVEIMMKVWERQVTFSV